MGQIGYSTIGGGTSNRDPSFAVRWNIIDEYSPASSESLVDAFIYCQGGASNATAAIGISDAATGALVEQASVSIPSGGAAAWRSASFPGVATLDPAKTYRLVLASPTVSCIYYRNDRAAGSGGFDLDASSTIPDPFTQDGTEDLVYSAYATTVASSSGPTLDTVPATAYPGQSRTIAVTGAGATQGAGGFTVGGVAQTITSWSDTSITFTTVLGSNSYGTGKTVELTTDAGGTATGTIELVADTANGFGVVTMSSPNTTDESSVAFGATPTVVTGDQFEWEDFNNLGGLTIDAEGFVSGVNAEGVFRGRFWDATDSTWGTVETFTAEVPGSPDPTTPTDLDAKKKQNKRRRFTANLYGAWRNRFGSDR